LRISRSSNFQTVLLNGLEAALHTAAEIEICYRCLPDSLPKFCLYAFRQGVS
jgi:hypothetical protein